MRVHVKLTEPIWRTVGTRDLDVEIPTVKATIATVLDEIASRFPKFGEEIYSGSSVGDYYYGVFVNDRVVNLAQRNDVFAEDGDEIFVLLPVAGGSLRLDGKLAIVCHSRGLELDGNREHREDHRFPRAHIR